LTPLVTSNATITCVHGGEVQLVPTQTSVTIRGASVLCEPDLVGAVIVGCAQAPSPGTKPCTTVVSILPGSTSPKVTVGGRPAYVATLSGLTDSVPPGSVIVAQPGQTLVGD
jgi:hypothetical protein